MEWINILASIAFFICTSIGTLLNLSMIAVIGSKFSKLSPQSHYVFVFYILLCDMFEFFVQFTTHIPVPLMSSLVSRTYQQHPLFAYFTAVDNLARYGFLNLTFGLCLNLLYGFCFRSRQKAYCGSFAYLFVIITWIFSGGIVIILYLLNCKRLFDTNLFTLLNKCDTTDLKVKLFYRALLIYFGVVIVIEAVIIIYGNCLISKRTRKPKGPVVSDNGNRMYPAANPKLPIGRSRVLRSRQLLKQAALFCIVYIIDAGLYFYGPLTPTTLHSALYFQLINIARNCVQLLCQASRPLILYFFDSEIKSKTKDVLEDICQKWKK